MIAAETQGLRSVGRAGGVERRARRVLHQQQVEKGRSRDLSHDQVGFFAGEDACGTARIASSLAKKHLARSGSRLRWGSRGIRFATSVVSSKRWHFGRARGEVSHLWRHEGRARGEVSHRSRHPGRARIDVSVFTRLSGRARAGDLSATASSRGDAVRPPPACAPASSTRCSRQAAFRPLSFSYRRTCAACCFVSSW